MDRGVEFRNQEHVNGIMLYHFADISFFLNFAGLQFRGWQKFAIFLGTKFSRISGYSRKFSPAKLYIRENLYLKVK